MYKKLLLTGGAGFIASNLLDRLIKEEIAEQYVVVDALYTGSNREWLQDYIADGKIHFIKGDLSNNTTYHALEVRQHTDVDAILHLAAESHVDRSILDGSGFGKSNVLGTMKLLEWSKDLDLKMFLNFSTDEVMGSRTEAEGPFQPHHRKMPRNPYSATKSAQEDLGFAYSITHGIPVVTTRATNIYGRRQFPEKFLPVIITKLINKEKIPLYGEGLQEREWVHVDDVSNAVIKILEMYCGPGSEGLMFDPKDAHHHIHHIAGEKTYSNIEFMKQVIRTYAEINSKTDDVEEPKFNEYFEFVEDRKGHDFRYDLDASSTKRLGWSTEISLEEGLEETIKWYLKFYEQNPQGWGS